MTRLWCCCIFDHESNRSFYLQTRSWLEPVLTYKPTEPMKRLRISIPVVLIVTTVILVGWRLIVTTGTEHYARTSFIPDTYVVLIDRGNIEYKEAVVIKTSEPTSGLGMMGIKIRAIDKNGSSTYLPAITTSLDLKAGDKVNVRKLIYSNDMRDRGSNYLLVATRSSSLGTE